MPTNLAALIAVGMFNLILFLMFFLATNSPL